MSESHYCFYLLRCYLTWNKHFFIGIFCFGHIVNVTWPDLSVAQLAPRKSWCKWSSIRSGSDRNLNPIKWWYLKSDCSDLPIKHAQYEYIHAQQTWSLYRALLFSKQNWCTWHNRNHERKGDEGRDFMILQWFNKE